MNRLKLVSLCFVLLFSGCTSSNSVNDIDENVLTLTNISEQIYDDFVIKLETEKEIYNENEVVVVTGHLKYIGEKEEISIYHGASPFFFNIKEVERDIEIPYFMELPSIETKLIKNQWYSESYRKSGGYGESDPEEYVTFMKEFLNGKSFPNGTYDIELRTDFYAIGVNEEKYIMSTTIKIKVE